MLSRTKTPEPDKRYILQARLTRAVNIKIEQSSPFALMRRINSDEPCTSRNAAITLPFWNSYGSFQTSSFSSCLPFPSEIIGHIQDIVRNCHNLKLSSGLRLSLDGAF